jgi:uncharacterized 2Fe-2S/4Fe-4S cluster protein (DUF4445 family)
MVLGLIPDCDLEKVSAVGNAAGDGARFALLNQDLRRKAAELVRWVRHISTPMEPSFQDEFVAALDLPHASDAFPTLKGILPEASRNGRIENRAMRAEERRSRVRRNDQADA